MFVPFLIMLREGLEAALIVSLIASYLKRTQRGRWIGVMWVGVFLAAALCPASVSSSTKPPGSSRRKSRSCLKDRRRDCGGDPHWMVFWMRKVSRNVKVQLEQAVDNALQKATTTAGR